MDQSFDIEIKAWNDACDAIGEACANAGIDAGMKHKFECARGFNLAASIARALLRPEPAAAPAEQPSVEQVARAIMIENGCGLTIDEERVLCDHPKALERPLHHCDCRASAAAVLALFAKEPS